MSNTAKKSESTASHSWKNNSFMNGMITIHSIPGSRPSDLNNSAAKTTVAEAKTPLKLLKTEDASNLDSQVNTKPVLPSAIAALDAIEKSKAESASMDDEINSIMRDLDAREASEARKKKDSINARAASAEISDETKRAIEQMGSVTPDFDAKKQNPTLN